MQEHQLTVSDYGELRLLREIFLPDVTASSMSINDDCAHIALNGSALWSIDPCPTPVASFFDKATPEVWGWYTAVINLSDIAASGGNPIGMLVSLDIPDDTKISALKEFQAGLMSLLKKSNTLLLGGNIKSAKKFAATGTILGSCISKPVTRSVDGDEFVVCMIGNSGKFWASVVGNQFGWGDVSDVLRVSCEKALCFPEPQVSAGRIIGSLDFPIACMDCSDGPANALYQLANINNLSIVINEPCDWPLDKEIKKLFDLNKINLDNACLSFGDWQLMCLVPISFWSKFEKAMNGITYSQIGRATHGNGVVSTLNGRILLLDAINQNFSGGYNSIGNVSDLINIFMRKEFFR